MKRRRPDDDTRLSQWHRRLLLQLVTQARRDLEKVPLHAEHAIHAVRTRMKKLAAITRLGRAALPPATRRTILAATKRVRKSFAALRDSQVLTSLGYTTTAPGNLKHHRDSLPLFEEMALLERTINDASPGCLRRENLVKAYLKTYREGREQWKTCLDKPQADNLHTWRKPVKDLYYQTLALHRARGMKRRIRRARKLGRLLGHDHDLHVAAGHSPSSKKLIKKQRAVIQQRIFKLAKKLFAPEPHGIEKKLVREG